MEKRRVGRSDGLRARFSQPTPSQVALATEGAGGYGYDTYVLRKAPGEANGFALWGQLAESSQQASVSFVGGTGPYVEAFNFVHP